MFLAASGLHDNSSVSRDIIVIRGCIYGASA
jgi:hypothetical protein